MAAHGAIACPNRFSVLPAGDDDEDEADDGGAPEAQRGADEDDI
jgi:hypothetical protein